MGEQAVAVKGLLQRLSSQEKQKALQHAAGKLTEQAGEILGANAQDMDKARAAGMKEGLLDRLLLTRERIEAMARGLCQVAMLPDCIGEIMEEWERPNGLRIRKVRVPLGVVGIIYEARPNVTADAFGLCFQAGNAVILKGGSDAICSNRAIVKVLREAMEECGIPGDVLQG